MFPSEIDPIRQRIYSRRPGVYLDRLVLVTMCDKIEGRARQNMRTRAHSSLPEKNLCKAPHRITDSNHARIKPLKQRRTDSQL